MDPNLEGYSASDLADREGQYDSLMNKLPKRDTSTPDLESFDACEDTETARFRILFGRLERIETQLNQLHEKFDKTIEMIEGSLGAMANNPMVKALSNMMGKKGS